MRNHPALQKATILLSVVALTLTLTSCKGNHQPIRLEGKAQGSYYSILYYDSQRRHLDQSIDSLLKAFDQEVSLWEEGSLLRRVNSNHDSVVTPLFADILQKSLDIQQYTSGAFDCRIGRLVQAWGFSFSQQESLNDTLIGHLLAAARQPVTRTTRADGQVCIRKAAETEIDFNAIAQGYASDLIATYLLQHGITDFLVDVGGEVVAHGCKKDGSDWCVGIERPAANRYDTPEVALAIGLRNRSVVTSGSYRKYYERDGVRYSHTIDPATGRPVTHSLLSVSVVDSNAWRADALATAFMVMGVDSAWHFIERNEPLLPVLFIYDSAGEQHSKATPAFEAMIQ